MQLKWSADLNPGQTPVDISHQPVYALSKELRFCHLENFSQYFPIFGQTHTEQCSLYW